MTEDVAWLPRLGQEWAGLARLAMVESHRTVNGQTSIECRYFISSRACKAQEMAGLIRAHWGIENSLHGVLDVSWARMRSKRATARRRAIWPCCARSR